MSVQDIQNLYKLVNDLRVQVGQFIGKSNSDHEHLSESFEDHVEEWKDWKGGIESQLNAIANALLQDQTRGDVEKAVEEKTEQKSEKDKDKSSDKRLLWQTTIVLAIFSILSNLGEIFGFLAKIFSFLAG